MSAVDTSELERLHPASFAWALACCGYRHQEAQDVLQSCYLKVLDGRAQYGGRRSSLKTWFFAVIRRTVASRRRRTAARRVLLLRFLAEEEAPDRNQGQGLGSGERTRIITALRQLPRRQREVLELVFYQDLSLQEAAGVMEVSLGATRAHYHRAKAAMLGRLSSLEGAL